MTGTPASNGDDELISRLRATLHAEADAVEPFGTRTRSLAVLAEHDARRRAARRRRAVGVAAVAAAAAAVGLVSVGHRPAVPTRVGVAGGPPSPTAPVLTAPPPSTAVRTTAPTTVPRPAAPAPSTSSTSPTTGMPAGFAARSVTFVTSDIGWVLGTLPCRDGRCVALAATWDGGATWHDLGEPSGGGQTLVAGASDSLSIRFADTSNGWIFGQVGGQALLWSTHDGGGTWTPQHLPGGSGWVVTDLEAAAGQVRAVAVTAEPPAVELLSSPRAADAWAVSARTLPISSAAAPAPELVLQHAAGWVAEDGGQHADGARLVGGTWQAWTLPCHPGAAPPLLAAPTATWIAAGCTAPSGGTLMASSDGGRTWVAAGDLPAIGVKVLSASAPGALVVGGTAGGRPVLETTPATGAPWRVAWSGPAGAAVTQLGFESATQGVAVATGPAGGMLLMTHDGGVSWQQVDLGA